MKEASNDCYDVFNGDADGICALHQLRLADPRPGARLVTGVKRDIKLLGKIRGVKNARITVLDVSLDRNRPELEALLAQGCEVCYIDHHFAGDIPASSRLTTHIDPDPDTCTSLIVDGLLHGRYRGWAVAAAFGDNQHPAARRAAAGMGLNGEEVEKLREIGELLNYNGYGGKEADLHLPPAALYEALHAYIDPLEFYAEAAILKRLRQGYADDMATAQAQAPLRQSGVGRIFSFPDAPWARRVAGSFVNLLAREQRDEAHALLVDNGDGSYMVSLRAPLARKEGADQLCRRFPTGGGRAAAAGINALPQAMLDEFLQGFEEVWKK